jgi:Zn finger protein HypA/HybF involved in hydrogenase expression
MKMSIDPIECACCLGAKQLTANGKSFIDCPLCQGGKIEGEQLQIKNILYLQGLTVTDYPILPNYYDNNEY